MAIAASGYATMAADTTMPVRVYVVNGIAIDSNGVIYTANTGTGEIIQHRHRRRLHPRLDRHLRP